MSHKLRLRGGFGGTANGRTLGRHSRFLGRGGLRFLAFLEIVEQFPSTLIALPRIFRERLHDQVAQKRMHLGVHMNGRDRREVDNALAQILDVIAVKRHALGHHLVENGAQTEKIGAAVGVLAEHLLGRQVVQDSRNPLLGIVRELAHAGDAETENLDRAVPPAHDFGGLKAVVDDALGGGKIEAGPELAADIKQIPYRETFFAAQHGGDAVALHVFHGSAELAFHFARAEDRCDVGAAENLRALGFREQRLFQSLGVLSKCAQLDSLQGNGLAGFRIVGFVDDASGRFRQLTQDFKVADFRGHFPFHLPSITNLRFAAAILAGGDSVAGYG